MQAPEEVPAPYDLLAADHDLPAGRGAAQRSYVICSTPRSGSTLLAEAMHRTGQLAIPAEYFEIGAALPYLYNRWQCTGFEDYVRRLHDHRSTDSGLFGVKTHWHQLVQFCNMSQGAEPLADIEFNVIAAVLRRVTPHPKFIFVTRNDKARQAVSHWVASKTQRWIRLGDAPASEPPPYDFAEISEFSRGIDASETFWNRFFALGQVEPMRIVYEDFVADYDDTVVRAAQHVGGDVASLTVAPPRMRRQSNELSREYAERYRRQLSR
jgi:LPS sulfotransferase NodH